ncbi:putative lipoprotein, partial [Escherichia coli EC1863]
MDSSRSVIFSVSPLNIAFTASCSVSLIALLPSDAPSGSCDETVFPA